MSDVGTQVVLVVEDIEGNSVKITFWEGLPGLDHGELDSGKLIQLCYCGLVMAC